MIFLRIILGLLWFGMIACIETNGKIIKQLNRYDKDCESAINEIIFNGGLFIPTASILVKKI